MVQYVVGCHRTPPTPGRAIPDKVLDALDRFLQRNLLEETVANRKRIAFLFEHSPVPVAVPATWRLKPAVRPRAWSGFSAGPPTRTSSD